MQKITNSPYSTTYYTSSFTVPARRTTQSVQVGNLLIGSNYPIRVQTMANVDTNDIEQAARQVERCAEQGAELFRFTTQGMREVESLALIRTQLQQKNIHIPLVADVHFRADVADKAAEVADKVRINPGNYIDPARQFKHIDYTDQEYQSELMRLRERFVRLLTICRLHHTALRLGVNHGSLSDRIMSRYGNTEEGMVESLMEFLRIAKDEHFDNIVLSIKASSTHLMVSTVCRLVQQMDAEDMHFPLHLGVTEAGEGEDGRIKSAVGIGALLAQGIGDTIRVSLSEDPEQELPVARALIDYFYDAKSIRYHGVIVTKEQTDIPESRLTLIYSSTQTDWNLFVLQSAAECGKMLWEIRDKELAEMGCWSVGIHLKNPNFTPQQLKQLTLDIMQGSGIMRYKTEFVSCPGCGRTLFDLQQTVAQLKQIIPQQPDDIYKDPPKIAVMGCIVNGPGEMADADYGYVGAARGKVSLYKGKQCIEMNIPASEAADRLLQLIQQDNQ
ncbi:MAG: (E)-4-hydroxy-3-methylbut-2-enyl-diphosphate synthase [Paludibacteraceae bacterium]|nr:(E)-4-hydroxy-3-methylbut-2-enyl-diphosphate synthase [Paludibacteraceae bacterium]